MKDFLPYKRYTPLDTVYLIGLGGPTGGPNEHLRGPDNRRYQFQMEGVKGSDSVYILTLKLLGPILVDAPAETLISAAFKIAPGDTLVVGTSRLDRGKALVLLVTAVK
jgi:hypothetical protein